MDTLGLIIALALFIAAAIMVFVSRSAGLVAWAVLCGSLGGILLILNHWL
jgi:hypothetical protein